MTLRIGDKVVIGSNAKFMRPEVIADNARGVLVDLKWNLGLVQFTDGQTEWITLNRLYKAAE